MNTSARRFASSPKARNGFTLIELLVVIAIIAILAAILFPVFAQAREKARQTTCLSNMKQVSLGFIQYAQDYDETFVPYRTAQPYIFQLNGVNVYYGAYSAGSVLTGTYWAANLQPYEKAYAIFHCPDAFDAGVFSSVNSNSAETMFGHDLGLNADYTMATSNASGAFYSNTYVAAGDKANGGANPEIESNVVSPAKMVMVTDNKIEIKVTGGGGALSYYALPGGYSPSPACWTSVECGVYYSNVYWGANAFWNTAAWGGSINNTSSGGFMPRHNGGGNVAFMDGHAKWYTPGNLAVGTNWTTTTDYNSVNITNESAYLWTSHS